MTRILKNCHGNYRVTEPSKMDPNGLLRAPLVAARCGEAVFLTIREHAGYSAAAVEDPVSREVFGSCGELAERSDQELRELLLEPLSESA